MRRGSDVLDRFVWVTVPAAAGRVSRGLALALSDGQFLLGWRVPAGALALGVLVVGFAFGALSLGYDAVFTESLTVVCVAALLGALATGLGVAFLAGFVVGDFFIAHRTWLHQPVFGADGPLDAGLLAGLIRIRVPLLIAYMLLAVLVVGLPTLTRALLRGLPGTERLPRDLAYAMVGTLSAVGMAWLASLWANGGAAIIRPVYTWVASSVATSAVETLQRRDGWIAAAAVVGVVIRSARLYALERGWAPADQVTRRLAEVQRALPDGPTLVERVPPVLAAVASSLVVVMFFAGVLDGWITAAIMFATLLVLRLLRVGVLPLRLDPWRRLMQRVPLLLRLVAAFLLVSALGRVFAGARSDDDFSAVALFVTVSVVCMYLLVPGPPLERADPQEAQA